MKFLTSVATTLLALAITTSTQALAWTGVTFIDNANLFGPTLQVKDCEDFTLPYQITLRGYKKDTTYAFEGGDAVDLDMFMLDIVGYSSLADATTAGTTPIIGLYTLVNALPASREGAIHPSPYLTTKYGPALNLRYDTSGRYLNLTHEQREKYIWTIRVRDFDGGKTTELGKKLFVACKPATTFTSATVTSASDGKLEIDVTIDSTRVVDLPNWPKSYTGLTMTARKNGSTQSTDVTQLVTFNGYFGGIYPTTSKLSLGFLVDKSVQSLDDIIINYRGGYENRFGSVSSASSWPVAGSYPKLN